MSGGDTTTRSTLELAGSGPSSEVVPVLAYSEPAEQYGVIITQEGSNLYVLAPRPAGFRMFYTLPWALTVFFGLDCVLLYEPGYFPYFPTFIVSALLTYNLYTLWRKRVFLVSRDELRYGIVIKDKFYWTHHWPRRAIGEVKLNAYDGKLIIRVTGKDMKELRITSNKMVTQFIADTLQRALSAGDGNGLS